ncbi:hypothetical protein C8Q78DRAFT_678985 [Trametes maxima]|nr:hypothetical protein C8Q78DRAFT_678985 [Trametes maxima]
MPVRLQLPILSRRWPYIARAMPGWLPRRRAQSAQRGPHRCCQSILTSAIFKGLRRAPSHPRTDALTSAGTVQYGACAGLSGVCLCTRNARRSSTCERSASRVPQAGGVSGAMLIYCARAGARTVHGAVCDVARTRLRLKGGCARGVGAHGAVTGDSNRAESNGLRPDMQQHGTVVQLQDSIYAHPIQGHGSRTRRTPRNSKAEHVQIASSSITIVFDTYNPAAPAPVRSPGKLPDVKCQSTCDLSDCGEPTPTPHPPTPNTHHLHAHALSFRSIRVAK